MSDTERRSLHLAQALAMASNDGPGGPPLPPPEDHIRIREMGRPAFASGELALGAGAALLGGVTAHRLSRHRR